MKVLVTGGGGFLGEAIIRQLVARGTQVRSLARNRYPALADLDVEQSAGDLSDPDAVRQAARDCELVYHVAAKAGIWGSFADYWRINVLGTRNVLEACRALGIGRLVYTSSPSVVFDGGDLAGVDERVPYPSRFKAYYPQTKAVAEQEVLAANGPDLATVALRPHLIWGPGDNHLVPRILSKGRSGRLRRIGNAPCLIDSIYIDNAADAHVQAADALDSASPVAGRAYFLSNDDPRPLWEIVNAILRAGGLPPVTRSVPRGLALTAGALCEQLYRILRLSGEPPMTRFLASELSTSHWFDIRAARRDFGYQPRVSIDEGMERLAAWLARQGADES